MLRRLSAILLLALCALAAPAAPALATCGDGASTCFVRGVGGSWNTTGTWATSSGGADCVCTPATGDSIVMDAASGNSNINASFSITNLNATGFTGTLTHSAGTLTSTGTIFTFSSAMTYTSTRPVTFTGSGTLALTSAGKSFASTFTINGTGTVSLQDAFTMSNSNTLSLVAGTLDTNGFPVSVGAFGVSNSNTRALILDGGTLTLTAVGGTVYDSATATNYTVPANGTIQTAAGVVATTARVFSFGSNKVYGASLVLNGSAGQAGYVTTLSATAGVTLGGLDIIAPAVVNFGTATFTIASAFNLSGSAANAIALMAASGSTPVIAATAGSTCVGCAIAGMTFTGSPVATASFSMGNNSGITISPPITGSAAAIGGRQQGM